MKKQILCSLVLLGLSIQAHAVSITLEPADQTIQVGQSVLVNLVVSDLGDDVVSAFDLDLAFDDTILSFLGFEFGTDCEALLGGPSSCLDFFGGGSLQDVFDLLIGVVNVFEFSFDFDDDLAAFQPNDFVLGTFEFLGSAAGFSALDILVNDLATLNAGFLDAAVGSGSITVQTGQNPPTPVPEPGTLLLLTMGLLGLRMARPKAVRA